MLSNCPKCESDNIGIWGMSFITVKCNNCYHEGKSFRSQSRRVSYNRAITNWNMGVKVNDQSPLNGDTY